MIHLLIKTPKMITEEIKNNWEGAGKKEG